MVASQIALLLLATGAPTRFVMLNVAPGGASEVFTHVREQLTVPGSDVAVGVASIFSYLNAPLDRVEAELREFLRQAGEANVPVVVQLDGEQWWAHRPDLWNWWDPAQPGYDPANRACVEWDGWGPEHAIRIAWRNWGRQIRVLPPPNLMHSRYRAACHEAMRRLVPIVLDWQRGLPEDRRYLLVGLKLGWESSIGVNSFYYANGNALLDQPADKDSTSGIKDGELPARGVAAIGYAAVTTAGLATSGELREEQLTEVTRRHLDDLCQLAHELGCPRERLFTHCGGWHQGETLYHAARNAWSCPGWSFYQHARNPTADASVMAALAASDAPYWGAVEWLPLGASTAEQWRDAVRATLDVPRCRYLCVYNWSNVKGNMAANEGLKAVLAAKGP